MTRKIRIAQHPIAKEDPGSWFMTHPAIGTQPYNKLGKPTDYKSLVLPDWWLKLPEATQDHVLELWSVNILKSLEEHGITEAYIEGGYSKQERTLLAHFGVPEEGHFSWSSGLVAVLPRVTIENLAIKDSRSVELLVYEGWDNVFISNRDILPEYLKTPANQTPSKFFLG